MRSMIRGNPEQVYASIKRKAARHGPW